MSEASSVTTTSTSSPRPQPGTRPSGGSPGGRPTLPGLAARIEDVARGSADNTAALARQASRFDEQQGRLSELQETFNAVLQCIPGDDLRQKLRILEDALAAYAHASSRLLGRFAFSSALAAYGIDQASIRATLLIMDNAELTDELVWFHFYQSFVTFRDDAYRQLNMLKVRVTRLEEANQLSALAIAAGIVAGLVFGFYWLGHHFAHKVATVNKTVIFSGNPDAHSWWADTLAFVVPALLVFGLVSLVLWIFSTFSQGRSDNDSNPPNPGNGSSRQQGPTVRQRMSAWNQTRKARQAANRQRAQRAREQRARERAANGRRSDPTEQVPETSE